MVIQSGKSRKYSFFFTFSRYTYVWATITFGKKINSQFYDTLLESILQGSCVKQIMKIG